LRDVNFFGVDWLTVPKVPVGQRRLALQSGAEAFRQSESLAVGGQTAFLLPHWYFGRPEKKTPK